MSKKKTKNTYTFEYNPSNNLVTKTDVVTGNSWSYLSRSAPRKPVFAAKNGITVEQLQSVGHNVRVKHIRWAMYAPHMGSHTGRQSVMAVPSTFRKDYNYLFFPKGGFTHVVIKKSDGGYVCVSSECSIDDPFCYAAGVAAALDRLTDEDIDSLGL